MHFLLLHFAVFYTSILLSLVNGGSVTFQYTGKSATWTVPDGVYYFQVVAYGASGGSGSSCSGGKGGQASGTINNVTPGDIFYIYVGGAGSFYNYQAPYACITLNGGYNGGGLSNTAGEAGSGGGSTDIRTSGGQITDRILVAGGGGGCSNYASSSYGGGAGGGLTGGNGNPGGGGGTQTNGGARGNGPTACNTATNGQLFYGGDGSGDTQTGGGGGGGYYGGGGGGGYQGGGGGSSYIGGVINGATTAGVHTGNGQLTISWDDTPSSQPTSTPTTSFPSSIPSANPTIQPNEDIVFEGGNLGMQTTTSNPGWYLNHTFTNLGYGEARNIFFTSSYFSVGFRQTTTIDYYLSETLICTCTAEPSSCQNVLIPCCFNQIVDSSLVSSQIGGSLFMKVVTSNNANVGCPYQNSSQLYVQTFLTINHGMPTFQPTKVPTLDTTSSVETVPYESPLYVEAAVVLPMMILGAVIVYIRNLSQSTDEEHTVVGALSYVAIVPRLGFTGYVNATQIVVMGIFLLNSSQTAIYGTAMLFVKLFMFIPALLVAASYYGCCIQNDLPKLMDRKHLVNYSKIYALVFVLSFMDSTLLMLLPWKKNDFYVLSKGYPSVFLFHLSMYPRIVASFLLVGILLLFNMNVHFFDSYSSIDVVLYLLGLMMSIFSLVVELVETSIITSSMPDMESSRESTIAMGSSGNTSSEADHFNESRHQKVTTDKLTSIVVENPMGHVTD